MYLCDSETGQKYLSTYLKEWFNTFKLEIIGDKKALFQNLIEIFFLLQLMMSRLDEIWNIMGIDKWVKEKQSKFTLKKCRWHLKYEWMLILFIILKENLKEKNGNTILPIRRITAQIQWGCINTFLNRFGGRLKAVCKRQIDVLKRPFDVHQSLEER